MVALTPLLCALSGPSTQFIDEEAAEPRIRFRLQREGEPYVPIEVPPSSTYRDLLDAYASKRPRLPGCNRASGLKASALSILRHKEKGKVLSGMGPMTSEELDRRVDETPVRPGETLYL